VCVRERERERERERKDLCLENIKENIYLFIKEYIHKNEKDNLYT